MPTVKTEALLLNAIRWKESSKIITFYTAEAGKIKVIARGAFKKNSPLRGKLESLQISEAVIQVKESRSLQILQEIEVVKPYNALHQDLTRLPYGLAVLETISQLFEDGESDPVFFNFVCDIIDSISNSQTPDVTFLYYLLKLASYLGFKPALQNCASGDSSNCALFVNFSMENGSVTCSKCATPAADALRISREEFFFLKNLQKWNHRRLNNWKSSLPDTQGLIYHLINYVNYHIEKNLYIKAFQLLM